MIGRIREQLSILTVLKLIIIFLLLLLYSETYVLAKDFSTGIQLLVTLYGSGMILLAIELSVLFKKVMRMRDNVENIEEQLENVKDKD